MHAFGISDIVADVGREEDEERFNDVFGKSQAGEVSVDNIPNSEEGPSYRSEACIQMPVGENLGDEGHDYNFGQ